MRKRLRPAALWMVNHWSLKWSFVSAGLIGVLLAVIRPANDAVAGALQGLSSVLPWWAWAPIDIVWLALMARYWVRYARRSRKNRTHAR